MACELFDHGHIHRVELGEPVEREDFEMALNGAKHRGRARIRCCSRCWVRGERRIGMLTSWFDYVLDDRVMSCCRSAHHDEPTRQESKKERNREGLKGERE